jgi:hypothetical protein
MAFPGHSQAADYVKQWQMYRPKSTPYFFGWGYGADLGGLSGQPGAGSQDGLTYPFKSYDGSVTFDRQRTGDRVFDYTKDGVAHYGLYADWFADLRRLGGAALQSDMYNGAEAYLQMWERADGISSPGCAATRRGMSAHGLGALRLGDDWQTLLRRAGQPQQRTRAWSWCVAGKRNAGGADVAVLSDAGKVQLAGSTAHGRSAAGVAVGAAAAKIASTARSIGAGVRVLPTGPVAWVYVVRGGRVRAVAAAAPSLAAPAQRGALREAVTRLLDARATQARPEFAPSAAQAATRGAPTGRTLAGSIDPRLNATLALLCHLQL